MKIIETLKIIFWQGIQAAFPDKITSIHQSDIEITQATQSKFGHYQCNSAMKLTKSLKKSPREIAELLKENILKLNLVLNQHNLEFSNIEIAGPGFLNITLSNKCIENIINTQLLNTQLLNTDCNITKIDKNNPQNKVVIDFSSPNVAKEMHVGHLRTTIIGDSIARILEFKGYNVLRLNHIGDWGTQFGMLIAYLKNKFPNINPDEFNLSLPELMILYKESKVRFDNEPDFKIQSQQEVIKLQAKDKLSYDLWLKICAISKTGYQEIYDLLDIKIIDRGESFYNSMLPGVISNLENKKLIQVCDGAKCVFLDGFINRDGDPLPLIIQKSDGGFNYATTDLAALDNRVNTEKSNWLIYVVDKGQSHHLAMIFATGAKAKIYDPEKIKIDHVDFGLVLKDDGTKFKTREGNTERLVDLINNAVKKAKELLLERESNNPDIDHMASVIGINAIKYADLATNRTSDYKFSYNKMLQFEGNTAAFLLYAYVRTQSIQRKINNLNIQNVIKNYKIVLSDPKSDYDYTSDSNTAEISLALHICQFQDNLDLTIRDLMPHRLCDYLFKLAEKFHLFFHHCRVEGSDQQNSRVLLCHATANVLAKGFDLLGLKLLNEM